MARLFPAREHFRALPLPPPVLLNPRVFIRMIIIVTALERFQELLLSLPPTINESGGLAKQWLKNVII